MLIQSNETINKPIEKWAQDTDSADQEQMTLTFIKIALKNWKYTEISLLMYQIGKAPKNMLQIYCNIFLNIKVYSF